MVRPSKCPHCGVAIELESTFEGTSFNCVVCGQIVEPAAPIGLRPMTNTAQRPTAVADLLDTALSALPLAPPPRPLPNKNAVWLIVAAAVLGLAGFGGAVALLVRQMREGRCGSRAG